MAMVTFLFSSLESCGGSHGLCHHLLDKMVCPSSPKKERNMTMAIFFLSSVESCGGDHGISSREEEVCSSRPKHDRSMTMINILLSSLESCGGDMADLLETRRSALLALRGHDYPSQSRLSLVGS